MTEAEWLAAIDPKPMLQRLKFGESERKLLLFCVGCCRSVGTDAGLQTLILEAAERYADGIEGSHAVVRAGRRYASDSCPALRIAGYVEALGARTTSWAVLEGPTQVAGVARQYGISTTDNPNSQEFSEIKRRSCEQADLLREIFGNPFRAVTFSFDWRTSTATTLASQMYESRDFGAMPILADALQDAGCDNADVLDHCRGPGPHVRGCWVIDLLTGRE